MVTRRQHAVRVVSYFLVELLVLAGSFFAAYAFRLKTNGIWGQDLGPLDRYLWLLPASLLVWSGLIWIQNTYHGFRTRSLLAHGFTAAATSALGVIVLFASITILKQYSVNRSLVGLFGLFSFLALFASRAVASAFVAHYTQRGYDRRYVLIGGTGPDAVALAEALEAVPGAVYQVRGFVDESEAAAGRDLGRWKVLGGVDAVPSLAGRSPVDEIYLLPGDGKIDDCRPLVQRWEAMGITVHVRLSTFDRLVSRMAVEDVGGAEFLTFSTVPRAPVPLAVKRLMDVLGALALLGVLWPVMAFVALLVRLTSGGPAIFRQERAGMNGRIFTLYKFRTMVAGAERERANLESRNEMDGPVFKMRDDPRLTGLGKMLRKLSIDELPQLWNIIQGDMSLVGPRPLPVYEVEKFEPWQRRRMSMRPGITGLWQVGGRSDVSSFAEWMRMDLEYVDRWSIRLDLLILLKTIPAVLRGKGAY